MDNKDGELLLDSKKVYKQGVIDIIGEEDTRESHMQGTAANNTTVVYNCIPYPFNHFPIT